MSADVGCCSPAAPCLSSPRALGRDFELDTESCLVAACLTRHKQNQYFSLIMLIFAGGSWSWLSGELLSVFIRRSDGF